MCYNKRMRGFFLTTLFVGLSFSAYTQVPPSEEPEIVIEMQGAASSPNDGISVWDKNALQLTKLFRGKTRTQVLYTLENVSSKDGFLQAQDGTRYAYVQYGTSDDLYRKFLFKENDPQTFVVCAGNLKDVLAVNKKYGVNLGVHLKDFLRHYENTAVLTPLIDKKKGKELQAYRISYTDINHKQPAPHYFIFEKDELIQTFSSEEDFFEFMATLSETNQEIAREAYKQQEELQKKKRAAQKEAQKRAYTQPRKALVSGGTVEDQMYMPRAVNAKKLPPLKKSKEPAGTPMLN